MTPLESVTVDLQRTTEKWRTAVRDENREAETVCMKRLNELLDLRLRVQRTPPIEV